MDTVKEKNILLKILPKHGWIAVIIMIFVNIMVYNGSRVLTRAWDHYNMTSSIDKSIPFIKEFVIVYIPIAYLQWLLGFYYAARENKMICARIFAAEILAKLMCLACFLLIPTTMMRADVQGGDLLSRSVYYVYRLDSADNLFPSIHCLESYILMRTVLWLEKAPKWYKLVTVPAGLLVMLSTVFMKQHVIVDVIAAIVVVEIGIFAAKKIYRRRKTTTDKKEEIIKEIKSENGDKTDSDYDDKTESEIETEVA
jgi:PAP2 superfamily.